MTEFQPASRTGEFVFCFHDNLSFKKRADWPSSLRFPSVTWQLAPEGLLGRPLSSTPTATTGTATTATAAAAETATAKGAATASEAATPEATAVRSGAADTGAAAVHREVTPTGETATANAAAPGTAPAEGSERIPTTPRSTKGAAVSSKGTIGPHPTATVKAPGRSIHRSTVRVTSLRAERIASGPLTAVQVAHALATTPDGSRRRTASASKRTDPFPRATRGTSPCRSHSGAVGTAGGDATVGSRRTLLPAACHN